MEAKHVILSALEMHRNLTPLFVKDLADDTLTAQPANMKNHAAWQMGHIAFALAGGCWFAGGERDLPEGWGELFGAGSTPQSDRSIYPSKQALVAQLDKQGEALEQAVSKADASALAAENPREAMRRIAPTVAEALVYLTSGHYGYHLGQLAAWRNAMGLPKAFPR